MYSKIKSELHKNLVVYYLLLAGFLIRLIFASFPGFHVDTDTFFAWSVRAVDVGLPNFYSRDVWTNYTPGMIYVFYLLGVLRNLFSISDQYFYFVLKLPSIIADLILSYYVYKVLLKTVSQKTALYGLAFCLFNPVLIFNSAIWGAFDGFMTLFLFFAVYNLARKKLILSSLFFGIALLIKPQAVAIAPVFAFWLFKNFSLKNTLRLSAPGFLTIIALSIPYFPTDPLFGFFNLFRQMAEDYKGNSMFAYNLWGIFGFWIDDGTKLGFLSYRIWGYLLFSIFWVCSFVVFFKKKILDVFLLSTLAFLAFFFLPTRVHERYLFSAIPFLILVSIHFKSRTLIMATIFLTLLHLLNLYYVYIYYNEFYLKLPKTLYIPGLYESLESDGKFLSALSTLIFGIITVTIFKFVLKVKHYHG
jgi:dolichyl-phosphate-mannose-protein mannosyltransferase